MLNENLVSIAAITSHIVLYALMGLSVVSLGMIVERWWYFRRRRLDLTLLSRSTGKKLAAGDVEGAMQVLRDSPAVEAAIAAVALESYDSGPEVVREVLESEIRLRRKEFESGLVFLGTVGNNAPFIGLFGTVLGVVTAFHALGDAGLANDMGNVMNSIAEALIATALGILVALPAVVAFNVFSKRTADIEENVAALGNLIAEHQLKGRN